MQTTHHLHTADAREMQFIPNASVHLVVTSPPYPMIEMWDAAFGHMESHIADLLDVPDGLGAFSAMHAQLDRVWAECFRILAPGGFACINIGDATRTVAGDFRLFHNHARIITAMAELGFTVLPDILWRKPTNAPNKFMGSGMLPAGAYVTYEHEYVLVFRKGAKREFRAAADKARRMQSAFFWEERNVWFSDVWTDLRGVDQTLKRTDSRPRSGAFPFELPYRLINMYSAYGDTIVDPFVGTGTSMVAAAAASRNSIGIELDPALAAEVCAGMSTAVDMGTAVVSARLDAHRRFVEQRTAAGKPPKHFNDIHDFPVITSQERTLELFHPQRVMREDEYRFRIDAVSAARPEEPSVSTTQTDTPPQPVGLA